MKEKILNIGCGKNKIKDAINLDVNKNIGADLVWDIDKLPLPFTANYFDKVLIFHVLEHIKDIKKTLEEIHRITKKGALIYIKVPHYTSPNAYTDFTHRHFFGHNSFSYFENNHALDFYTRKKFKIIQHLIILPKSILNIIPQIIAKKHPFFYENHLGWIFPAQEVDFIIETLK